MEIRYTSTLEDYVVANREALLHRGGLIRWKYRLYVQYAYVIGPLLAIAGFLSLIVIARHGASVMDYPIRFLVLLGIAGAGIGWLFNPGWHRHKLARIFKRQKGPHECALFADATGIVSARTDGAVEGRVKWSMFEKSVESEGHFVLLVAGGQGFPVPKKAMTAEQQIEFRAMLATHISETATSVAAVS